MNFKKILFFTSLIVSVFAIGFVLGFFSSKTSNPDFLNSKVISLISASGQVAEINGRNLKIISGSESMKIIVKDAAKIYSMSASLPQALQKEIKFENIKKGDNVSINIESAKDGIIYGTLVVVLATPQ